MKQIICLFIVIEALVVARCAALAAASSHDRLMNALIEVESSGNDNAIGDRHKSNRAYGPLQIRQLCVDDVNQRFGTKHRAEDMLGNRSLSRWVCQKYLEMYATRKRLGRKPTEEDMARIWNGGPHGWKKGSTRAYWSKVENALENQSSPAYK